MSSGEKQLALTTGADGALVVAGELDSYTAPDLADRLGSDPDLTVIDLAGVTFIDSAGLRVLIEAHQARATNGSSLRLRSPSPNAMRLFEISGLIGHLDVMS